MAKNLLLTVGVLFVCASVFADNSLIVKTEYGQVAGDQNVVNGVGINTWLGVPYGAAPVDDLRWKPPTNPQVWSNVKYANSSFHCLEGRANPAKNNSFVFMGDEKTCLQVNIWAPATQNPINTIMVWIHGGGNANTGPDEHVFDGSKLVSRSAQNQGEPIIVIAVGYRLGGLGFMAMPELTRESADASSGNYGLLDQIFALKWVKRNAHAFGASQNPRVVVSGQSAGAYDISALLASPLATGLFDGAILESNYQVFIWKTLATAEQVGSACAAVYKCQSDDAAATLACMRSLSAANAYLCQPSMVTPNINALQTFNVPNVDGFLLKCNPIEALQAGASGSERCGKLSQAPIMVGSSLSEGTIFATGIFSEKMGNNVASVGLTTAKDIVDLYQSAQPIDTKSFPNVIDALYPVKDYVQMAANLSQYFAAILQGKMFSPTNATNAQLLFGDVMFTCSALLTSSVISNVATSRNAYLYLFNHTPSNPVLALLGPTHTSEMAYVFGTFDEYVTWATGGAVSQWAPTPFEQAMSRSIMDYWLNFARYSNPNGAKGGDATNVEWPTAGCGSRNNFMVFGDKGPVVSTETSYHHQGQCSLWQSYSNIPADSVCGTSQDKGRFPIGVAVGGSVGGLVLVAILVGGLVFFVKRRTKGPVALSRFSAGKPKSEYANLGP